MKCSCCGASLLGGRSRCAYCGVTADIDLMGKHYYTTETPEIPRPCPSCGQLMKTVNVGLEQSPFLIERCEKCLGLFFDPGELDSIIEHQIRAVFTVDRLALAGLANTRPEDEVKYRKCPICSKLMNRTNFGGISGVITDQCRNHGLFLDAGELHHILQWTRSGGSIAAAQERQMQKQTSPQKQFQKSISPGIPDSWNPQTRNQGSDIFDHAIEFLLSLFGSPRI